jgi:integrase
MLLAVLQVTVSDHLTRRLIATGKVFPPPSEPRSRPRQCNPDAPAKLVTPTADTTPRPDAPRARAPTEADPAAQHTNTSTSTATARIKASRSDRRTLRPTISAPWRRRKQFWSAGRPIHTNRVSRSQDKVREGETAGGPHRHTAHERQEERTPHGARRRPSRAFTARPRTGQAAVAGWAGLRRAEIRALRVSDVERTENVIRIVRSMDDSGAMVEPKSRRGTRKVPLAPQLLSLILEHLARTSPPSRCRSSGYTGSDIPGSRRCSRPAHPLRRSRCGPVTTCE